MNIEGVKIEDISVDLLDELEAEWEDQRIRVLVRQEIIDLGDRYRQAQLEQNRLGLLCMLRARKLMLLGYRRSELAPMFGVDKRTINKWTKGIPNG